nr:ABC transporter substrate-binding protein [Glycomyces sp. L485]
MAITAACSAGSAADEDASGGGVLRYGTVAAGGASPVTDPHGSLFNESDWVRHTAVYDLLLRLGDDHEPAPALATGWEADDDATEWTFTIRDDAEFSDGSPVTAADVLYSMERMDEQAAANGGRLGTVDVSSSEAVDETTLVVATTTPDAELPRILAGMVFVVPDRATEFDEPVGSGPYLLDEIDAAGTARLSRNPDWWGGTDGPAVLELHGFEDPQALASALTSGALDVAAGVSPAAAKAAVAEGGLELVRRTGAETAPLLMRLDAAPFDDPQVRRAVKLALDRPAMVEQVYLGYGTVGNDMIKLADPSVPADAEPVEHDLDQARDLLAEAGHPDGFAIDLHTTTAYPSMLTAATVAAQQLGEIGIDVTVEEHSPSTYWSEAYTVESFTVGYYTDTPFATTVRQTTLTTSAFSDTGWSDEDFDAAFAAAMATVDDQARNDALGELHHRMAAEGGWAVWGFGDGLDLRTSAVEGLPEGPGRFYLAEATVGD